MLELFIKGGPVMLLLLLCSVVGVYIVVQKWLYLRENAPKPALLETVKRDIQDRGEESVARDLLRSRDFSSRVYAQAIRLSQYSKDEIREGVSELVAKEMPKFEKNMSLLASIITVAPILGLLGTVLGLMSIFNVISGGGIGDAGLLASGIAQALITTVTGLSIAIPFIFLHHYLGDKIDTRLHILEGNIHHIVTFCKQLRKGEVSSESI